MDPFRPPEQTPLVGALGITAGLKLAEGAAGSRELVAEPQCGSMFSVSMAAHRSGGLGVELADSASR